LKPKLVIILALIVLSPLAVILWLGARVVRDERLMVEHRVEQLMRGELRGVAETIARAVSDYEQLVLDELNSMTTEREHLRQITRRSPYARQFFVLDARGRLLHPPVGEPDQLTDREREAMERTRGIWADGDLTISARDDAGPSSVVQQAAADLPEWHVWYWQDGLQMMLWQRREDGVRAAELNRVRFVSEIIAALPETEAATAEIPAWRIRLVDSKQMPLYQWGPYEPDEGARPVVEIPLEPPLGAWSLQYHATDEGMGAAVAGSVLLNAVIGLFALAAVLVGLAYYFYREQSREMREAAQRVSFVNQVSHELKTPLTNIRMYAELLERDAAEEDEPSRWHLGVIVSESQRLSRLIGNILTFSRKQRQALELHRKPGVVDAVLRETLDHLAPALTAASIEVRFDAGAEKEVLLDADVLEQIVGNLASNVEKYGAGGGRMDVKSDQRGETVTITVTDHGPGIPASERERIFRPFYRISTSLTEGVSGSGIGLAVARELARLHGGELELLPSARGACFRLTLHCPLVQEDDES